MNISVVGLGYVGLPMAGACIEAGHSVVGFDIDASKVDRIQMANEEVGGISSTSLTNWLAAGLQVTGDPRAMRDSDAFVICVPTPLNESRRPDLAPLMSAIESVAAVLDHSRKPLVMVESTTHPGTTRDVLLPILLESGLSPHDDFCLAYSPERIDPGNDRWTLHNTPKLVGSLGACCQERAESFLGEFVQTVYGVSSLEVAEISKLLENTYRHVNIALINEFAEVCSKLSISITEVVEAASTKPYGYQPFWPGPGVGGHCIPVDPSYLATYARDVLGVPLELVELAELVNLAQPSRVASRVRETLANLGHPPQGGRVLLLGSTYKANVADMRESPFTSLASHLRAMGIAFDYHDPFIQSLEVEGVAYTSVKDLQLSIDKADLIVLLQHHDEYLEVANNIPPERLLDAWWVYGALKAR